MSDTKEAPSGSSSLSTVEWRIQVDDHGAKEILAHEEPKCAAFCRLLLALKGLIVKLLIRIYRFLEKAWKIGVDDPRKFVHCLRVGIALCVVSLFYYMRPLYKGVGGNAIWAVMTVVVVFEYTVGATLYKSLNRITATSVAGFLAIGVHWIASQSGKRYEPIIMGFSVFLLASAATFSRFIPVVKARFDYGITIFILTFSLVSVSGYRVEKLVGMAHQRISTIIIGTSLCIIISLIVYPIWAGEELHLLIIGNMDKVASSLDCCAIESSAVEEDTRNKEEYAKNLEAYKCALNSKASEDSLANFARWEPAHGRFNFKHPWKQYLKIGASIRNCAYCIEALNSCISSEDKAPDFLKKHISETCSRVSSTSSNVIRELALTMKTMQRSSLVDISVEKMNDAVRDLQENLKSLSCSLIQPKLPETKSGENVSKKSVLTVPLVEVIPFVSFASLLTEITGRIEGLVKTVKELANLADFKAEDEEKPKQSHLENKIIVPENPNQQKDGHL